MSDIITATKVRLSFANLLEPRAQDNAKPDEKTYSTAILIPKSDTATVEAIRAAVTEAMEEGVVKKWNGNRPRNLRHPLRDGDEKTLKDGVTPDPTYAGHWFINAKGPYSGSKPPILFDKFGEVTDKVTDIYSGVWGFAKLQFFPYSNSGNNGVGAGISTFASSGEGESLGSVETVESARAGFNFESSPASEAKSEMAAATSAPAADAPASASGSSEDVWS